MHICKGQNKNLVVKANDLIRNSRFSLSLQQQKIVLFLISQIKPQDKNFHEYEFSVADFCHVCGLTDGGKNYSNLKQAIKDIADKSVWIRLENGRETLIRWIEKASIESGIIHIRLDDDMKPFLLRLKENYTMYELYYTLNFHSRYSIRLYELAKSVHYHKRIAHDHKFSVDEIKTHLGAETYTEYRDLKKKVLSVATKEISEKTDITVEFEEIKLGRKVIALTLKITPKTDKKYRDWWTDEEATELLREDAERNKMF